MADKALTEDSSTPQHNRDASAPPDRGVAAAVPDRQHVMGTGLVALFVSRPVLACVFSALILVAGIAAWFGVEVRELPDVDRPVISISTDFPGASPETIDRELSSELEGAVARVAGVRDISSTSTFGRSRITVEFTDDADLNAAASDIRDAMGRVLNNLPEGADDPRIVKADANDQPVLRLAVTSAILSQEDLTILVEDEVVDRLATVPGVADVRVYGDREKVFRIDIDQTALAVRGLSVADLLNGMSSVSFDVPAGSLTSVNQDLVVRATADIRTPADFENLFIGDGVRMRDVATVTLGPDVDSSALRANGQNGVGMGVIRQAQSNTLDISAGVRKAAEDIQAILPQGVTIRVTSDDAVFVRGAIEEVIRSLMIAVMVVIAVIYLFILDRRATLVPAITLPVALVGTIAAIYLAGFSLNILTLLAIVLATGMVVDDAIVVLENIVRRRHEGLGPRAAAVLGTREVFFAVVTTTATLAAVFVPLSFLPGQAGGLFREFGFVLAFAVLLSSVVALTLCPMLASRLLADDASRHPGLFARLVGALGRLGAVFYRKSLHMALDAPLVVLVVVGLTCFAALVSFGAIRSELTPREDRSVILMSVSAPQGVSLDFMRENIIRLEERLQFLVDQGEVNNVFAYVGSRGQANSGFMVLTLVPWDERARSQDAIAADVRAAVAEVPALRVFVIQPNSLRIRGAGNGLSFALLGNDYDQLADSAEAIVRELEADPRFGQVRLSYERTQPQLSVVIDRDRAADLGIDISRLGDAVQAMLDGRSVGDVFVDGRSIPVRLLSTTTPVNDPTDLENIYLRTDDGRSVPMSTIATLSEQAISPQLNREQQFRSVSITAGLTPDFALGEAISEAERLARPLLPAGSRIAPLGEAASLEENSNGLLITFGFAVIVVFLVLAAQFESFASALIVMATVPVGLACAVFALLATGTSLNVYSQIGLVMIIGIMAKNGILIVEFANQLRDGGLSVRQAIEQASNIRLRPVMMTMISTVLGGVPLVMAFGAGAEAREALGWVIVGGLGLASISTLYLTPVAYLLLARLGKPRSSERERLHRELHHADIRQEGASVSVRQGS